MDYCPHCGQLLSVHCPYCSLCACLCDELGNVEGER